MSTLPHALVADDEPNVRAVTTAFLTAAGYVVTSVADGVEAADALLGVSRQAFDVAVIDCVMPRMNGPDTLARVRAAGCLVPVLLVSGSADPTALAAMSADERAAFLPKPFTGEALAGAVATLVATGGGPP